MHKYLSRENVTNNATPSSRRSSQYLLGTIFALTAVVGAPAVAQDASDGGFAIEEVTVTASKRESSLQDTSIAITAMTGDQMSEWNIENADDFATFVPGLWIGTTIGNLQVSLRGVSNDSFFLAGDSPVAFNVDGVFRGRQTGGNASFHDAQRVEVLKGPQGTLYGRNATAGAINVISNKPTNEFGGHAEMTVGDYSLFDVRGVINAPVVDDVFAMRLAFMSRERDGYFDNGPEVSANYSDVDEQALRLHGLYTPNDRLSMLFTIDAQQRGGVGDGTQILAGPDAVLSELEDPLRIYLNTDGERDDDFRTYSTEINYDFDNTQLTYIGAYLDTSVDMTIDFDRTNIANDPLSVYVNSQQWSHEFRLASTGDNTFDWLFGTFFFDEDAQRATDIFITLGSGAKLHTETEQPDFNVKSQAVFGQGTFHVSDTVSLTAGLRYTKDEKSENGTYNRRQIGAGPIILTEGNNSADWSSFDWLVGVDWYPVEDTLLYAKVATGYKSGGFNDVLQAAIDGPEFDPEEILSYQFGHKSQFMGGTFQMNSEAFYYDYTDLQVNQLIEAMNIVRNAASATIYGAETEIVWLPSENFRVDFNLSYLKAEYDKFSNYDVITDEVQVLDGSTMAKSPEVSGRLGLDYVFELANGWQLTPRLSFAWSDDTKLVAFDDPGSLQESWTRTDVSINLLSPSSTWSVQLYVNNLEDDVVFTNGGVNGNGVRTLTARPPRMYGGMIRYSFGN